METLSVRLEENLARDIEHAMKENRYATKTEFVREAIRDKVNDLKKEQALAWLKSIYGAGKGKGRNITDEDIHRAGEKAVRELAAKLGVDVD